MSNIHPQSEYYLHENGSVIYKPHGGVDSDSCLVKKVWNANFLTQGPHVYLDWLKELHALGANTKDLTRLWTAQDMDKWVPEEQAAVFKQYLGIS
jgi:hypothetical protein